ncbi:hypothetical protein ACMHYJ_02110 [Castellaniella hirudinis]|uniref:hypothetical protein n=1 Tax=Castellaniella hirudinis TaxID=1144617 RepID=UPI0039C44429
MSVTTYAWGVVALCFAAAGAAWFGYSKGYDRGALDVRAVQSQQQVAQLTGQLGRLHADLQASATASRQLREGLAKLAQRQTSSTQELKNALQKNAADPVLCRFDVDSMRIIDTARAAAAQAAAGGIRGALPASD